MMHGHEKSDSVIVAVKPANKVGQPAADRTAAEPTVAELVERRAGTKGNADWQSTRRTQSRVSVSQALERKRQVNAVMTRGGSRMRESCKYGSVRGAPSNGRPYRDSRREFLTLLGGAAAWPLVARAQQPAKVVRIGFLRAAGPNERDFNAFRSGLHALGYIEGQNIVIEQRYAAGAYHRVSDLAAELVRLKMDVIVVDGPASARPAKAATSSIPIVFTLGADPVADGLVASMARPRGNLTGLTLSVGHELAGKRVELLKDIKPDLARLAILKNPNQPSADFYLSEAEKAGRALGLTMRTFDARSPDDLPAAFATMVEWRADGLSTLNDGMFYSQRERVAALARDSRLVGVHPETAFVEAGGLLSYGPSLPDLFRRAASYVDKILKGQKPADLPVEQPTKFELVVNLKTARTLGLMVSRDFLLRVDEVIE